VERVPGTRGPPRLPKHDRALNPTTGPGLQKRVAKIAHVGVIEQVGPCKGEYIPQSLSSLRLIVVRPAPATDADDRPMSHTAKLGNTEASREFAEEHRRIDRLHQEAKILRLTLEKISHRLDARTGRSAPSGELPPRGRQTTPVCVDTISCAPGRQEQSGLGPQTPPNVQTVSLSAIEAHHSPQTPPPLSPLDISAHPPSEPELLSFYHALTYPPTALTPGVPPGSEHEIQFEFHWRSPPTIPTIPLSSPPPSPNY
jgi:hypothetical protein